MWFVFIELFATEDSDIILPCSPIGNDDLTDQVFDWKKNDTPKDQEVFLYDSGTHYNNGKPGQNESFKNRVEFFQDMLQFGNASIRIKNTKLTDAGNYSCAFPFLQPPEQKVYVKLVVGKYKTFGPIFKGSWKPLLMACMVNIFHTTN